MAKGTIKLIGEIIVALAMIGCDTGGDDYFYNDHGPDLISSYSVVLRSATSPVAKSTSAVLEIGANQLQSTTTAASSRLEWNENVCYAKLSDLAKTWTISFVRDGEREPGCRIAVRRGDHPLGWHDRPFVRTRRRSGSDLRFGQLTRAGLETRRSRSLGRHQPRCLFSRVS
jgi:hypothetical protein